MCGIVEGDATRGPCALTPPSLLTSRLRPGKSSARTQQLILGLGNEKTPKIVVCCGPANSPPRRPTARSLALGDDTLRVTQQWVDR